MTVAILGTGKMGGAIDRLATISVPLSTARQLTQEHHDRNTEA